MALILWTCNFLEAQGFEINSNAIYQDNKSAMLLERNGTRSASKRTRHLEIRYFFVTDNVARNRVSIVYCPTTDMIADFFTKPLQGSQFHRMVKLIMNLDEDNVAHSPQECVGDHRTILGTESCDPGVPCDARDTDGVTGNEPVKVTLLKDIHKHDNSWMARGQRSFADVVRGKKKDDVILSC